MTSGLVLVDQTARGETIENRGCSGERFGRALRVVVLKCFQHLLDRRAQHRTLAVVAGIAHNGLLCALLGRLDIGHE